MTSPGTGNKIIEKPTQGVAGGSDLVFIPKPGRIAGVRRQCASWPFAIAVAFQIKVKFHGAKTMRQVEHGCAWRRRGWGMAYRVLGMGDGVLEIGNKKAGALSIPSKALPKAKTLAPHRYIISVNALTPEKEEDERD
jgi:hypothetical protein